MATSDQIQGEMELGYQHTLVSYIARLDYNILGTLCAPALFCSNEHESGYFLIALYVNERCSSINKLPLEVFFLKLVSWEMLFF